MEDIESKIQQAQQVIRKIQKMYRNIPDKSEIESIAWVVVAEGLMRNDIQNWENFLFIAIRNRVNNEYKKNICKERFIKKLQEREKCRGN